ncbi:hypothetical protein PIB30_006993 [Stylosanthes scabra]|uniref:Receptor-like serine/threonine-protein kinase n=1 Tax=Stylosanthes scabra TaxID=79078 RepID=A0ABU6Z1G8_9FABA|nr:hypothetical protein [Stylosanthes scabra]
MTVNDSLGVSQSMSDDSNGMTLVSKDGVFELGFFSPGSSMKRYLGIWYKKSSNTVVWVANRDNPIDFVSAGKLTINNNGNLILSQNDSVVWLTNSQRQALNPVAQLMDSGNLVVWNNGGAESNDILWQSFDYPTDKILPGMKVGWDLQRGLEWRITSWKSESDPSPGNFSWGLKLNSYPDFYLLSGKYKYNRFGPWNGLYFSGSPQRSDGYLNPYYEFRYVTSNDVKYASNMDEIYYTLSVKNNSLISKIFLRLTDQSLGSYVWMENTKSWTLFEFFVRDQCDIYGICGAYGICSINDSPLCTCLKGFSPKSPHTWDKGNWSDGCERNKPLSHNETFIKFEDVKVPDTTDTWLDENMSLDECRVRCLNNFSCTAFSNSDIRGSGSGCVLWFGDLIDIRLLEITPTVKQDLYVRVAASDPQTGSINTRRIVAITIPAILGGMLLLCTYFIYRIWRNFNEKSMTETDIERHTMDLDLPLFDLPTIAMSTGNFRLENKIGEGGFGSVYKGKLVDGQEIAVKRLSKTSGQGMTEFVNEVKLIAKLQHRNLVRLLGCCIEGQEKLLIYEYMANGSLDSFIFDHTKGKLLNWPQRFHIILGIAKGLLYLHQDSRLRIIHRDLKASNVLLDDKLNPKISDFGMAKAFGGDQTEGNTNRVVGTYGYMAPEYAVDGLFSIKSDVFSFGILLLEIICGNKNRALSYGNKTYNLVGYAWTLWKEGKALQLIDSNIKDSCMDSKCCGVSKLV